MQRNQITCKKEKEIYCKERGIKILSYSRMNELKLMKQKKRISRLRIQSNTNKEGKTLMKLKRVSKIKIQSNKRKEGKAFMKHQKDIYQGSEYKATPTKKERK